MHIFNIFENFFGKIIKKVSFCLKNMQIQRVMLMNVQWSKSAICQSRRNRSNLAELFAILARGRLPILTLLI